MSTCFYLKCPETHQFVHVGTTVAGGLPGGSQAHELVIQLFSIAHSRCGFTDNVLTEDPDPEFDSLEWELGNCAELYERMTQESLDDAIIGSINHARKGISHHEQDDYDSLDWLGNYTAGGRGLGFYHLHEPPTR